VVAEEAVGVGQEGEDLDFSSANMLTKTQMLSSPPKTRHTTR